MYSKKALYRKNNFGQVCVWDAEAFLDINLNKKRIRIKHGILNKTITTEIIDTNRFVEDEITSRRNAKRKAGYKYISEIKDNVELPVEGELYNFLDAYLPDYRTSVDGALLAMKAKVFDNTNNKVFKNCPVYLGQWKINGLRCFISAERTSASLFQPISLIFRSREGTIWTHLHNLEEYLLSVIPASFIEKMVEEHYILDGELYLPNKPVNYVNSIVKDHTNPDNKYIQFWCYDLAIESMLQAERLNVLNSELSKFRVCFASKEEHYNNTRRLLILPSIPIRSEYNATMARNSFIDYGFEGLILRNPEVEYQFGKRNASMYKYKKSTDGKFLIVDIKPEGIKRPDIPLFILKNDINDAEFEVHVGGSIPYQKDCLVNRDKYINKYMFVEYGERSGINQVPFHVKQTYIIS